MQRVKIPKDKLRPFMKVHCSWAKQGCFWLIEKIDGNIAYLITPTSGKRVKTSIDNLEYIERDIPK